MKAFWEIFWLEFTGFIRSRALLMLSVASVAWMFIVPYGFRSDGTDEGAREMYVRFSLGGVTALLALVLLVAAAGSLSRERAAKRLQLTMVRPVCPFVLVVGKIVALSVIGALVLALVATIEGFRQDPSRKCSSVYHPVLPSPAEEAAAMYEAYMADPETPLAVKRAKKSDVMRLLAQRAIDHYQTIGTNDFVVGWRFPVDTTDEDLRFAMRFRFTNMYNMRDEVKGRVMTCCTQGSVSNITQAAVTIPLVSYSNLLSSAWQPGEVRFLNQSPRPVMLRPRRDVELLVEVDGFAKNLARAYLQLVSMLTVIVAFGVFLGSGLSRPVAVFVAVVTLALSEMSPSVVEQCPDQLETGKMDAIGLTLARFAATITHPVGSLRPLEALAVDERLEPKEVVWTLLTDVVILPLLLSLLAAWILPRKQDGL